MPPSILILSGPIGAGKTTVASALVDLLPGKVAYIEGDVFWSFFATGEKRGPTPETFRTIMSSMAAAAMPYAMAGSQVVLDFSMPLWFLPIATKIAGVRQVPLDYVVLRPSEQACADRAATRTEGRIPDYSRFRDLYREFNAAGRHILADDSAAAGEMAARIVDGMVADRFKLE